MNWDLYGNCDGQLELFSDKNFEKVPEHKGEENKMYECFHCLQKTVVWQADFDFSDFGYEGEGIVQICRCSNCGAEIEYRIPLDSEEE